MVLALIREGDAGFVFGDSSLVKLRDICKALGLRASVEDGVGILQGRPLGKGQEDNGSGVGSDQGCPLIQHQTGRQASVVKRRINRTRASSSHMDKFKQKQGRRKQKVVTVYVYTMCDVCVSCVSCVIYAETQDSAVSAPLFPL